MTKHTPIPRAPGSEDQGKNSSLLERANAAFGLAKLGPASVPAHLPQPKPRAVKPVTDAPTRAAEQHGGPGVPPSGVAAVEPREKPAVVLGGRSIEINREALREHGLIVPGDPVSGLLEEFRLIKRELLIEARERLDPAARRVLLSSPHEGEGKTFCAVNLALALAAERDLEVLLIDADVMNPSLTRIFGIEDAPGFMDALADRDREPEKLAIATDVEGLFVMSAGSRSARDTEHLASAHTGEMLERLTQGAPNRFVIFDTPPALAASPAGELAAFVGQALLIVRADVTSRAAIDDAQKLLSACSDLKLLLNAAQFSPSGRRFGDYRRGDDA